MKLTEKKHSIIHHVLLYGAPKSGKTYLAGTLAEKYKLLWFDLENGYQTLTQLPLAFQENIDIISLPNTRSFPIAIETMLRVIKGNKCNICVKHGKIGCAACMRDKASQQEVELNSLGPDWVVVVDSGTELTQSAIAHITKGEPEDYKMKTDDWGNLGKLMEIFYSHIQNAPFHVVVITHETDLAKDEEPSQIVPSAGSRNFARNVAKYFGDVVNCRVLNHRHNAVSSTTAETGVLTGSRSGIALEKLRSTNLLDLFDPSRVPAVQEETPGEAGMSAIERIKAKMAANKATPNSAT